MSVKARLGRATMVEGVKDVLAYARAAYRGVVRKRARPPVADKRARKSTS